MAFKTALVVCILMYSTIPLTRTLRRGDSKFIRLCECEISDLDKKSTRQSECPNYPGSDLTGFYCKIIEKFQYKNRSM